MQIRVISLLPAATEIVAALGQTNSLIGRSHECDWPPDVESISKLTAARIDPAVPSSKIDEDVKSARGPLFSLNEPLLAHLAPDLILTQAACDVCAIDAKQVISVAGTIHREDGTSPNVLTLSPQSLEDLFSDIARVGDAVGEPKQANCLIAALKKRCDDISTRCHALSHGHPTPTVALIEWLDPPMSAGNWVPEMIQMAGATDALKADAGKSHWIEWTDVAAADPDIVILIPCGFELERVLTEAKTPAVWPHLKDLRATREGKLFGVDGHHLFNRPGPRLVDSLEVLAELLHPESFRFEATARFAKRIEA